MGGRRGVALAAAFHTWLMLAKKAVIRPGTQRAYAELKPALPLRRMTWILQPKIALGTIHDLPDAGDHCRGSRVVIALGNPLADLKVDRHHPVYCVYAIQNGGGRFYIGMSEDVAVRVVQHHTDISQWTKHRGPWTLLKRGNSKTFSSVKKAATDSSVSSVSPALQAHNPACGIAGSHPAPATSLTGLHTMVYDPFLFAGRGRQNPS